MNKILLIYPVVAGLIGVWIAGEIEDYFTPQLEIIPDQLDCDNIKSEEWIEICENTQQTTKSAISIFHIAGFVVGFGLVFTVLKKLGIR